MVDIEPVNGPPLDVCGIMQACKAGGRAAPFCDRVMQERLPAEFRDRGGKLLGGSRDLEHNSHLFGDLCMVGFQGTHHAVTPIDMEHDLVVVSRHSIIQNPGNSLLNIGAHLCQPGVELPKQEGIAYSTDDDRLVARKFRAFQFDRVCLCRVEAAVGHADSDRVYCFVSRLCDIDGVFWASVAFRNREAEIGGNRQVKRILDSLGLRTLQLRHLSMKLGRAYAERRLSDRERLVSAYEERDASLAVALTRAMVLRSLKIMELSEDVRAKKDSGQVA